MITVRNSVPRILRSIPNKQSLHADRNIMDPWQLIKDGQFSDAVDAYTQQLTETRTVPSFRNRAIAHLNLGHLDLAMADFESAEGIGHSRSDGNLKSIGVVHWLSGRESDAVKAWNEAVNLLERNKIQFTDGAGGVQSPSLLWFAGARLNDARLQKSANHLLKRLLKTRQANNWPGPIGRLLLQRLDAETLRSSVSSVPVLRERELCQAEFYISVQALDGDGRKQYIDGLRRASDLTAALLENEFYLARHELRRAIIENGV